MEILPRVLLRGHGGRRGKHLEGVREVRTFGFHNNKQTNTVTIPGVIGVQAVWRKTPKKNKVKRQEKG